MMKVLFCNIAWMKFYNGITEDDKPINGGAFVSENNEGGECWNFHPYEDGELAGYVSSSINIKRLMNTSNKNDESDSLDNILVIWVAKDPGTGGGNFIVGWYKNATVYNEYFCDGDDRYFNITARIEDCILLPRNMRHKKVPRAGSGGNAFGMGQSNIWYAEKENAKKFVGNMIDYINSYDGDNWINKNREEVSTTESVEKLIPEKIENKDIERLKEGAIKEITINAYERNIEARRICINHYGTICYICKR